MAYRIVTQLFAERELRIVRVPLSSGAPKKNPPPEGNIPEPSDDAITYAPQYGGGGGPLSMGISTHPETLDSTLEFTQRSDSELRNRTYSRKAREKMRRVGYAAEYLYPVVADWWFLTITYPTEDPECCNAIADNSDWIVKELKNYLRKYETEETAFLYCWERQKRGTLHLHYGVYLPAARSLGFSGEVFHRWAQAHVHKLAARTGKPIWVSRWGFDWSTRPEKLQAYAQPVEKSIARYLSKYVSKKSGKHSLDWATLSAPKRWTGYSRNLHKKVEELTIESRKDYSNYQTARNSFENTMAKLRLFHPNSVVYYNRLSNCDGETFSLFKEQPCQRLREYMKNCKPSVTAWSVGNQRVNSQFKPWSIASPNVLQELTKLRDNTPKSITHSGPYSNFLTQFQQLMPLFERESISPCQAVMDLYRGLMTELSPSLSRSRPETREWLARFSKIFLVLARECQQNPSTRKLIYQYWNSWAMTITSLKSESTDPEFLQLEILRNVS